MDRVLNQLPNIFDMEKVPVKLDERKTEIKEDFVEQIDKEIETNIRKGVRK